MLSLLFEGGQAQRLQNRLTEAETELGRKDETIKGLELEAVEARSMNKALRAAASLEKKNAETAKESLKDSQAENKILQVEVRSLESKLRAKDEELKAKNEELKAKNEELKRK